MRGYFGYGLDCSDEIYGDFKEGFDMTSDLPDEHPYVQKGLTFYGHNLWPEKLPRFKPALQKYHEEMLKLGHLLMKSFSRSFNLPQDYFLSMFAEPMAQLRVLKYPPVTELLKTEYKEGAGAHTDFGWITMIAQDDVGGLAVQETQTGLWQDVLPIENVFIVNIGDLMERFTNGFYKSTMHKVKNNDVERSRYSMAFFMDPDYFAQVNVLERFIVNQLEERYEPITAGEYMDKRFAETTKFRSNLTIKEVSK